MGTVFIRIPQIGEGLQEARIVGFLKQAGDQVTRDEPIYQMETDKAVMDVESPADGILMEWTVKVDDVVSIGAEVGKLDAKGESGKTEDSPETLAPEPVGAAEPVGRAVIPPRTRAYAAEKGLTESQLMELASGSAKLMPADIDAFLGNSANSRSFQDAAVSSKQRILNSRLVRGSQLVIPGTITVAVDWEAVDREKTRLKKTSETFQPSAFTLFAFGVAQAVKTHPRFRTSIIGDSTYRTYDSLSLGIAVSLPEDELALAVIENADHLPFKEFAAKARIAIDRARDGEDQAHEAVTLSLTNMQSFGLRDAVPVVVPPSCATLFLGECYLSPHEDDNELVTRRTCNLALTFDHRVMNGVGAAQFMSAVRKNVEHIERLLAYEQG